MPEFTTDDTTAQDWGKRLIRLDRKEQESRRVFNPDRVHVSELISCLRRPVLQREYDVDWNPRTLLMFTMGRAFESYVFGRMLPEATEELEVHEEGIVGHIDFATDEMDYECKLTWKREPKDDDEVGELFDRSDYWVEQAGAYAVMRRRRACKFAVLHVTPYPPPSLRIYTVEWTAEEQGELWDRMQKRRRYLIDKWEKEELPMMVLNRKLCNSCSVKTICDMYGE